ERLPGGGRPGSAPLRGCGPCTRAMGAKTIVWSLCKPAGKRSSRETPHPRALRCAGHGRGAAPPGVCFLLGRSCMTGALVRLLPAGHRQIFELDLDTGELLQVTAATDGDSVRPSINFPGGVVVFESTAALKGGTSGVPQVFAFFRTAIERVPVTVLSQITNGAGPS